VSNTTGEDLEMTVLVSLMKEYQLHKFGKAKE
jgi:hypothetical protein